MRVLIGITGGMDKYCIILRVEDKELPRVGQLASCSLLNSYVLMFYVPSTVRYVYLTHTHTHEQTNIYGWDVCDMPPVKSQSQPPNHSRPLPESESYAHTYDLQTQILPHSHTKNLQYSSYSSETDVVRKLG